MKTELELIQEAYVSMYESKAQTTHLSSSDFEKKLPKNHSVTAIGDINLYHTDEKYFGAFDRTKQRGIIDHTNTGSGLDLADKAKDNNTYK
jgi:hypothetical protein